MYRFKPDFTMLGKSYKSVFGKHNIIAMTGYELRDLGCGCWELMHDRDAAL